VVNLHAQIEGLAVRVLEAASAPAAEWLTLIDLLTLRGHVLGRIADYERAVELAEQLVRGTTDDGTALLARARTRATFHRFAEALADLDDAKRSGLDRAALEAERAVILQAVGCHAQAEELHRGTAKRQPVFAMLGALAVLQAERGEVAEAERLFAETRSR
jgi:tetratricopeptide (TPR) repeat protein